MLLARKAARAVQAHVLLHEHNTHHMQSFSCSKDRKLTSGYPTLFLVCKFKALVRGDYVRTVPKRYAHTDLNEERVFTMESSVLEFWCALYYLDMSSPAFNFTIKGKGIRNLPLLFFSISHCLPVLRNFLFVLSNIAQCVSCLLVASPSTQSEDFASVPRQGYLAARVSSTIFPKHLLYSILRQTVPWRHPPFSYTFSLHLFSFRMFLQHLKSWSF